MTKFFNKKESGNTERHVLLEKEIKKTIYEKVETLFKKIY